MNQRIKQLIEQAEIKFESHPQHQGIDTAVIIPTDLEKFTELIVRECAGKCLEMKYVDPQPHHYAVMLKEHFGVE